MADDTTKRTVELSRRNVLGAMGALGAAGALGGAGTAAFFSDEEQFENNKLVAGELDLKVDWQQTYYGPNGTVPVNAYPDHDGDGWQSLDDGTEYAPGSPLWLSCSDLESGANLPDGVFTAPNRTPEDGGPIPEQDSLISLTDVKPGDSGEVTFSLHICDNPGYLWMFGEITHEAENGLTEPEASDPDEKEGVVELADEIRVTIWKDDDCDNKLDEGETVIVGGATDPANNPTLRDVLTDLGDANGIPLEGDVDASEGGGTGRKCFSGDTQHCIGFKWELPVDHANEIQTDSVEFDVGFYTEQCRHNDGFPNDEERTKDRRNLSTGVADWMVTAIENDASLSLPAPAEITTPHPAWATINAGDCSATQWVDPYGDDPTNSDPAGDYEYELDFEVPDAMSPRDLVIFAFGSDNPGEILLDGSTIHTHTGEDAYNPLDVTVVTVDDLAPGSHTLTAEVENQPLPGGSGENPTGLFVCAYLE